MQEIAKIKHKLVSSRELKKAKEQFKGTMLMYQESNQSVADYLGTQMILLKKAISFETLIKKIDNLTSDDIQKAANKYFKEQSFRLAVIGPYSEEQKKRFENLITLKGK